MVRGGQAYCVRAFGECPARGGIGPQNINDNSRVAPTAETHPADLLVIGQSRSGVQ
jgi:hypothetical protein